MGFVGTLINAKAEMGKNGNEYYKMSVDCDGESGSISCTKDVYDLYQTGAIDRFSDYQFTGVYNDQYRSLQLISVTSPLK